MVSEKKVKDSLQAEGYVLLGIFKEKSKKKVLFKCPMGHTGEIRWDHWRLCHRCAVCSGNRKLDISYVEESMRSEGYILLSKEYRNSQTPLQCFCPNGHLYEVSWNNWNAGYRCSVCSGRRKKSIEEVRADVGAEGYVVVDDLYDNNKQKLHLVCPNGHEYSVSWDNWNSKGSRCPKCSEWGISAAQKEIYDFVKSICSDAVLSDRKLISPMEIDILIPSKNIAIEYCGLYWHSDKMGKLQDYHVNKLTSVNSRGFRLVTVFEDEFLNRKEVVFSRLRVLLGCPHLERIYARKCVLKEIPTKLAREFCEDNHLQGYAGSKIKLGAFHKDELVSVMTFSKPSISKGRTKNYGKFVYELNRFCSKKNTTVVGIASKFLKYFLENHECDSLFSYADLRWSDGNLYNKLGFVLEGRTKPNYWYFKSNKKRVHRFALRKTESDDKTLKESVLRKKEGWCRIWDCGHLKFVLEKALLTKLASAK